MNVVVVVMGLALLVFVAGCAGTIGNGAGSGGTEVGQNSEVSQVADSVSGQEETVRAQDTGLAVDASGWRSFEFTDVVTGEKFSVADFRGKTILLESFAVWCPTCLEQQRQIQRLEQEDDSIVSISIDTDPNENADIVRQHVQRHGLDWRFAVSPVEVSREMVQEFGLTFASAPSAPVVLVCEDLSARLLPSGVKSPQKLKAEIAAGC